MCDCGCIVIDSGANVIKAVKAKALWGFTASPTLSTLWSGQGTMSMGNKGASHSTICDLTEVGRWLLGHFSHTLKGSSHMWVPSSTTSSKMSVLCTNIWGQNFTNRSVCCYAETTHSSKQLKV